MRFEFHDVGFSFDNIVVIPEPGTMGLLAVGAVLLRRKEKITISQANQWRRFYIERSLIPKFDFLSTETLLATVPNYME